MGQHVREPRELSLHQLRLTLRLTLCLRELISTPPSQEPGLRSFALIFSRILLSPLKKLSGMPSLTKLQLMILSWLEDQQEFPRFRSYYRTSLMAKSRTSPSILMKQLLMELL